MPKPKRIPSFLRLPGEFLIRVHQVKPGGLAEDSEAEWWIDSGGEGGTIKLPRNAARAEKIKLFDHELEHAVADWKRHFIERLRGLR